jgi:late competence protein required for DNA uptake (superfamily II DNA/RNA helicase)
MPNLSFCCYLLIYFLLAGDGKCVICDSFVNPHTLVHICDECNYGSFEGRCVVCGNPGSTDAYYCRECVQQGKDREGELRYSTGPSSSIWK